MDSSANYFLTNVKELYRERKFELLFVQQRLCLDSC